MNAKYLKKKMFVAGRELVVKRCLGENSRKTQCKQAALKDCYYCRDHEGVALSYYAMLEQAKHIVNDFEPEPKKDWHTVDQSAKKRWATMLEFVASKSTCS